MEDEDEDFLSRMRGQGLNTSELIPIIDKVCHIYGRITNLWAIDEQTTRLEVDNAIILTINLKGTTEQVDKKREEIRARLFDSGMFHIKITGLDPLTANCDQVVVGKKNENFDA